MNGCPVKAILLLLLLCYTYVALSQTYPSYPTPTTSTFEQLQSAYSGVVTYDATNQIVTFESSGVISFPSRVDSTRCIWNIPTTGIKTVQINANVTVTGQFTFGSNLTFQGQDKLTSIVYGTSKQSVLNNAGLASKYSCIAYSAFYGYGSGDNYIKNLTCLNPLGFMFTGKNNCRLHLDGVRGIDDRGGGGNHSDGISSASGSTVKNCYLATGDDAIKVYANILVENTEIVMVNNCVPIQYGWGTYGSGAIGTFKNVTISGTSGRSTVKAIINMASTNAGSNYNKTIIMDSCNFTNPNATLFLMSDNTIKSNVTITNSNINVKAFGTSYGTGTISICGSSTPSNQYNCLATTSITKLQQSGKIWPNPFTNVLYFETTQPKLTLFSVDGRRQTIQSEFDGTKHIINTKNLNKGIFIITDLISSNLIIK